MNNFDLFLMNKQKQSKSTCFGLFLSILTVFLFFYLLINEYIKYKQPVLEKNTLVYNHEKNDEIEIHIDIDMVKAPCSLLSFDLHDELLHHRVDIDEITKTRIDKDRKEIGKYTKLESKELKKLAIEDIKNQIGCNLKGVFKINKTNGNFHISYHNYLQEYLELLSKDTQFLDKIDLGYKLNNLEFKSIDEISADKINKLKNKFKLSKDFDIHLDKDVHEFNRMNALHFLEIIPTVLESEITNDKVVTFINSFHRNFLTHEVNEIPIVEFKYKFSAISVHYKEYKNRKVHFIVEVLGLFGGIYFILHLVKKFYFKIKNN